MCNTRLEDRVQSTTLLNKINLPSINTLVVKSRLRYFGHVCRSSDWINKITVLQVRGAQPGGQARKTRKETVEKDRTEWIINSIDLLDRGAWRVDLQLKGNRKR